MTLNFNHLIRKLDRAKFLAKPKTVQARLRQLHKLKLENIYSKESVPITWTFYLTFKFKFTFKFPYFMLQFIFFSATRNILQFFLKTEFCSLK